MEMRCVSEDKLLQMFAIKSITFAEMWLLQLDKVLLH